MFISGLLLSFCGVFCFQTTNAGASVPQAAELSEVGGAGGQQDQPEELEGSNETSAAVAPSHAVTELSQVQRVNVSSGVPVLAQLIEGSPSVTVCTAIAAGAVHDPVGAPGLQRVLAEILRDGGYRSSTEDYKALAQTRGATNVVEVRADATVHCTTVPSAEMELALWMTASRFSGAALTAKSLATTVSHLGLLAEQRDAAVHEGRAPMRLQKMAFLGNPQLGQAGLPTPEELDAITLEQLKDAHRKYYVARRAVISIVGGGTLKAARNAAEKYLPRMLVGLPSPRPTFALIPQHTMRFSMDEDRGAKTPAAWYGWVVPSPDQQAAVFAALSIVLDEPRLGKRALGGTRPAKRITLHYQPEATSLPTLARLEVIGRFNHSLGLIEKDLNEQLRLLARNGPSAAELSHWGSVWSADTRMQLATPADRATHLSLGVLRGMSAEQVLAPLSEEYAPRLPTVDQIKSAAASLLQESQCSVVEVYPKGWQDPWQTPMPLFHIVEKGQSLSSIAAQYRTTVAVITKMNGIKQLKPIYPGDKLKVPRGKVTKERAARTHQVRRGDTLSGIAVKYGVKVRDIAAANGMGSRQAIRTGETLTIPWPSADRGEKSDLKSGGPAASVSSPETAAAVGRSHRVSAGETLSGIAHQYGVTSVALAQANGISHKAMVKIGQVLKVPASAVAPAKASAAVVTYTVRSGDTLSEIARKNGVTVAELTVFNQMSRKATLRPGQTLKIPPRDP